MPWTIYWDNGIDCGTWGHLTFDTEEQAQEYANSVAEEYIAEGIWDEEGSAEPYWLEPPPPPEEKDEDSRSCRLEKLSFYKSDKYTAP